MKVEVENNKEHIDTKNLEFAFPEVIKYEKPINKEKQIISIQKLFLEEIGRELTDLELIDYLDKFNQNKTNFFEYALKKKAENFNKEVTD